MSSTSVVPDLAAFAKVPAALVEQRRWVCWRIETRDEKPTKVPCQTNGANADSTDPSTWTDYGTALNAYAAGGFDGIGFVLGDGYCGVDLDDCIGDDTKPLAYAQTIIDGFDTYTEISPSAVGAKMFLLGKPLPPSNPKSKSNPLPKGQKAGRRKFLATADRVGDIEMYSEDRFFAVTGKHLDGTPASVNERSEAFRSLYERLVMETQEKPTRAPVPAAAASQDDQNVIDKVRRKPEFDRLWIGNTTGYRSHSEADLALAGRIAFFVGNEPARIKSIFRQSKLVREKWDRDDYADRTVAKALSNMTRFYDWTGRDRSRSNGQPGAQRSESNDRPNCTDLGNGRRFVARNGSDVRYCYPWGSWLCWTGRRWRRDETGASVRLAKGTVAAMWKELPDLGGAQREEAFRWCHKSESVERTTAMLKMAQSEPGVPVLVDDLDRNPWLLNVINGTIDLRTGRLREHRRDDLVTKLAPVKYDPAAPAPVWVAFLNRITNSNGNLISFLQRLAGYSLTGLTNEQCLAILHGIGCNGKTTFLEALRVLLGEYAEKASFASFLAKPHDGIRNDLAKLRGARLVIASEVEDGRRLSEALVKELTGQEVITARFLYQEEFKFTPTFKLWFGVNHKPVIRGTDNGIWRRIRLVPFTQVIADNEKDVHLQDKLKEELPGILNWCVEGCLAWQRDGLGLPAEVRAATDSYREEMDSLAVFIDDCCLVGDRLLAPATPLYDRYKLWCSINGETPMSQRGFGMRLAEKGFVSDRDSTTNRKQWKGIGIKQSDSPASPAPNDAERSEQCFGESPS